MGLVSTNGLEVSRVRDDDSAGAMGLVVGTKGNAGQGADSECRKRDSTYAFKASREVDIVFVLVCIFVVKKTRVVVEVVGKVKVGYRI